jgi:hypothetical protein
VVVGYRTDTRVLTFTEFGCWEELRFARGHEVGSARCQSSLRDGLSGQDEVLQGRWEKGGGGDEGGEPLIQN